MSDVGISGAGGTNGSSRIDEAERQHQEEMAEARALLSQLTGKRPANDAETQGALRRFQLSEHALRDNPTGNLDTPTKTMLEKRVREKGGPLTQLANGIEHAVSDVRGAPHEATLHHVSRLSVGDSFEIAGSAKLGASGVGSEEAGALSITRSDAGTYAIEASGDYSMKGAGFASGGAGAGLKLVAGSKEDAVRLFQIMEHAALAAHVPLGFGALFFDTTAADAAFVHDHVAAISVSGEAAAKLKGTAGRPHDGVGALAEASVGGTVTERVTMEIDHGAIKGVILEASCKVKAAALAGFGVHGSTAPGQVAPGSHDLALNLEGSDATTISIKTHMDLPQHLTEDQRKMDPGTLFTSMQGQLLRTARVDVVAQTDVSLGGNRSWSTVGDSGRTTITIEGVKADGAGAIATALSRSDLENALAHVSAQRVTAKLEAFREQGGTYGGSLGSERSAELSLEVQTKERHRVYAPAPVTGTPREVLRALGQSIHTRNDSEADRSYAIYC